jgi:hypothetical protein
MLADESERMPTKPDQKRGSYKPAVVQALVIEGRKSGHSMRRIARDHSLDRSTVKNILSQPEIEMALQQSRDTVLAALPAISQMMTADILKERDRELGFQVLKKAGAFPREDTHNPNVLLQDNRLQIAIQTLLPGSRQRNTSSTPTVARVHPGRSANCLDEPGDSNLGTVRQLDDV